MAQELIVLEHRNQHESTMRKGGDMKHLVEFSLEKGGSILVEIDEPETGGTVRAGLSMTAGAFIASASAAANFGVTVRWTGSNKEIVS